MKDKGLIRPDGYEKALPSVCQALMKRFLRDGPGPSNGTSLDPEPLDDDVNDSLSGLTCIAEVRDGFERLDIAEPMRRKFQSHGNSRRADMDLLGIGPTHFRDTNLIGLSTSPCEAHDDIWEMGCNRSSSGVEDKLRRCVNPHSKASNDFMFSFNPWLDWTLTCQNEVGSGSSGQAPNSTDHASENKCTAEAGATGQAAQDDNDRSSGGGDEETPNPPHNPQPTDGDRMRALACPYLKHSPQLFKHNNTCRNAWEAIPRLK